MVATFSARQGEYLAFIQAYTTQRGVAPSFEEIGRHFGTTAPSVNTMIKTLARRGLLSRVPGAARTLRVLVPVADLPETEFGARQSSPPKSRLAAGSQAKTISVTDAVVAAAIAV